MDKRPTTSSSLTTYFDSLIKETSFFTLRDMVMLSSSSALLPLPIDFVYLQFVCASI